MEVEKIGVHVAVVNVGVGVGAGVVVGVGVGIVGSEEGVVEPIGCGLERVVRIGPGFGGRVGRGR